MLSTTGLFITMLSITGFSTAQPLSNLQARAGGPMPKPLPDTCKTPNPLLCTSAAFCPPQTRGDPVRPTEAVLRPPSTSGGSGAVIYGYYLPPSTQGDDATLLQKCLETCYGYGYEGDCKGVYQARNYPSPPLYGAPGGDPTIACLLFNREVRYDDVEVVPEDQRDKWTDTKVANIECQQS